MPLAFPRLRSRRDWDHCVWPVWFGINLPPAPHMNCLRDWSRSRGIYHLTPPWDLESLCLQIPEGLWVGGFRRLWHHDMIGNRSCVRSAMIGNRSCVRSAVNDHIELVIQAAQAPILYVPEPLTLLVIPPLGRTLLSIRGALCRCWCSSLTRCDGSTGNCVGEQGEDWRDDALKSRRLGQSPKSVRILWVARWFIGAVWCE